MKRFICFISIISILLGGCGPLLQTEYSRPEAALPEQWNAQSAGNNATEAEPVTGDAAAWPAGFNDPELSRLIKLALERNNDLAAAALRVRQATITAGLAYDDLLPDLSASVGSEHSKKLKKSSTGSNTQTTQRWSYYDWTDSYSASLGVSWEADLWGRLSSLHDAAEWEAVATEEDRRSAALSLVSTTMELYWQIAYRNVRLKLSQRNMESSAQSLELERAQAEFGASSDLEVRQAEQDLAGLKADHQTLLQSYRENLNSLAVLFDMPPGKVMADPKELLETDLPAIPAGIPAELLGRRPDLRAAELRLRKLLANTDAARSAFYPSLSLTGSLGSTSSKLSYLFENPVLTLASSIALPFLNWNNLELNLEASKAEFDEAVVNFRQTLYEALAEVENALSKRQTLAEQGLRLKEKLEAAMEVERIYKVRYKAGYGTFKDWLDAQDTRRSAEAALAENRFNRLANHVTLYKALGGPPVQEGTNGAIEGTASTS